MRVLGTILAVLVLAGCTGTPDAAPTRAAPTSTAPAFTVPPTPPRPVGTPLPVPVTEIDIPYPSVAEVEGWLGPPLGEGASAAEQILRHLRYSTLKQARVPAPTTATCDRLSIEPGAKTRCTVSYQGLPVPWTVQISADENGRKGRTMLFEYSVYSDRYVIRADVIRAEAWQRWGSDGQPVRCSRMPAVRVLPAGVTRDRCQHFVDGAWEPATVEVTDVGSVIVI